MTNIKTMPKDAAAEVLRYISEHEDFKSVTKLGGGDLSVQEVRALLRELSDQLALEASKESKTNYDVKGCKVLSKEAKNLISCLSPTEEKFLLSAFGLIDKKQP